MRCSSLRNSCLSLPSASVLTFWKLSASPLYSDDEKHLNCSYSIVWAELLNKLIFFTNKWHSSIFPFFIKVSRWGWTKLLFLNNYYFFTTFLEVVVRFIVDLSIIFELSCGSRGTYNTLQHHFTIENRASLLLCLLKILILFFDRFLIVFWFTILGVVSGMPSSTSLFHSF